MKKQKLIYWLFTGVFAFFMIGSAIPDVLMMPIAVKGMHVDLGYPKSFIPFIGTAKLLGMAAILLPMNARIKEWAYAGLAFDLLGATFSIIAVHASPLSWMSMLLPIGFGLLSYIYHHKLLKEKSYLSSIKLA